MMWCDRAKDSGKKKMCVRCVLYGDWWDWCDSNVKALPRSCWSYCQSKAGHTFCQGNLHRPLSPRSTSHHRRAQRLPCWIFAMTWAAHWLDIMKQGLCCWRLLSTYWLCHKGDEHWITTTCHSKMTTEQNPHLRSGRASMWKQTMMHVPRK